MAGPSLFYGALTISFLVHALVLLYLSFRPAPEPPRMREVAQVEVVDRLDVPKVEAPAPVRPKVVAPVPKIQVPRPGHRGTRPGVGGDPAPAPKSLKIDLPRSAPQVPTAGARVHRDRSTDGDPNRGRLSGRPDGEHGATGEGGTGPGGSGGSGDGGVAIKPPPPPPPPKPRTPEEVLKMGTIVCTDCHSEKHVQPFSVENLEVESGWDVRYGGLPAGAEGKARVTVRYEFLVNPGGEVEEFTVLETSPDPEEAAALEHFARMHKFTPGWTFMRIKTIYYYFRERLPR